MNSKKIFAIALSAAMLAGCSSGSSAAKSSKSSASVSNDRVYMLNFKPETNDAWQALAKKYNDLGGNVTVVTAASGEYNTQLTSQMADDKTAPTIFNVGNTAAAQTWDDYTLDLAGSDLEKHLTDKSYELKYNDKVAGIANCYESYGIIYNKTILDAYCGLDNAVVSSPDDIKDFDTLKKVSDDIQSRIDEINKALSGTAFDGTLTEAWTSSGLDSGSSWRFSGHLAGLELYYEFKDDNADTLAGEPEIKGTYLDNYKNVWDMYTTDTAANKADLENGTYDAESEFGMGEAVFYQNGDWEFGNLTNEENGFLVTADDLGYMPIYFGVDDKNEGLAVGTENYWAINSHASKKEQDASLAFLNWVITSDEGRDAVTNEMGLTTPFDTFTGDYATKNVLAAKVADYQKAGKTNVDWSFNATPNVDTWRADIVAPLTAYTKGKGSWDDFKTHFVNDWASEWKLAHADDSTSSN